MLSDDDAVTTAGLIQVPYEPLLDEVSIAVLAPGAEVHWELLDISQLPGGLRMLCVGTDVPKPVEIRLSVPLGDAAGYWHPQSGWQRTLLADWAGRSRVSLVDGHAAGCLYDHSGATLLTFAAADPVPEASLRFGVSEENDTHVVHLQLPAAEEPHRLLFVPRAPSVAAAMRVLRRWFATGVPHAAGPGVPPAVAGGGPVTPMPVPDAARTPVYSTWYAFNQNVDATAVERQAELAARLGCGVLILDDGWQELGHGRGYAGCGDWRPDRAKFPDFAAHVARVQDMGLRYMAWIAPLLLGPDAECFDQWVACAPARGRVPGAHVLDPRRPEVRRHVVELCTALVRDYGLDGLKVDFLNDAMAYADDGGGDVGRAMTDLLTEVRAALEAVHPEPLLELRQPYVGPGMAPYGNMLRSFDCPADATANRVRTLDTSLLAVGGAVHSDMLLWDLDAPVEAAARQLIGTLHSVPQISVRLDRLTEEHREALAFWLAQWRRLRGALLDGTVEPGRPDDLYTLVESEADGVLVLDVHSERTVPVEPADYREIVLVNGATADRLVLECSGPERAAELTVHDPSGRIIERCRPRLTPGLHTLPVPRMGLATLAITERTT
ncbi:glycoside hydrolase family 36 protein [Streptomyces sp. KR80]|uniref:glycoside hydrolase family 36 protein n=1 Tax=Streptomyces sp. KR80 TaxID=3457426 RepID=UPI003FD180C7